VRRRLFASTALLCATAALTLVAACNDDPGPSAGASTTPRTTPATTTSTTGSSPTNAPTDDASPSAEPTDLDEVVLPANATFGDVADRAVTSLREAGQFQKLLTAIDRNGEPLTPRAVSDMWQAVDLTSNPPRLWTEAAVAPEADTQVAGSMYVTPTAMWTCTVPTSGEEQAWSGGEGNTPHGMFDRLTFVDLTLARDTPMTSTAVDGGRCYAGDAGGFHVEMVFDQYGRIVSETSSRPAVSDVAARIDFVNFGDGFNFPDPVAGEPCPLSVR
jgi:hypothetical protein